MSFRYSSNDLSIIRMSGEVDYENCRDAAMYINSLLKQKKEVTCMEMDSLEFIDNSGLITLAYMAVESRKSGMPIKITSLNPHVERVLRMAGVWEAFDIPADVQISPRQSVRTPGSGSMKLDIRSVKDDCRLARNSIVAFGYQMGFEDDALEEIKLAMGEALSNAIKHGIPGSNMIQIQSMADQSQMRIIIKYQSEQFNPDGIPAPKMDLSCESGMGIHLIRLVMDSLHYEFEDGFAIVTMTKQRISADMSA